MEQFLKSLKHRHSPLFRALKRIVSFVSSPHVIRFPAFLRPVFRSLYETHFGAIVLWHSFWNLAYYYPLFQGRCSTIGRHVSIDRMPFVTGPVEIHVGDNVWIGGNVHISSAWHYGTPQLILRDHAELSWHCTITVNREVIIEEHARVSWNCTISDSDGHPRQADLRAQNSPVNPRDIRPVRISRHAWIGNGSHIMKGVTIGEGAVIGANSVVITDIPAYSLALGNPAEVVIRNYGRPTKMPAAASQESSR